MGALGTATPLSHDQRHGLRAFRDATSGYCDVWNLMGPRYDHKRAELMSLLSGTPVPRGKAGVMALRDKIREVLDVADGSPYKVNEEIRNKIAKLEK